MLPRDADKKERLRLIAKERHESIAELAVSLGLQPKSLQVVMSDPNKLISINIVYACVKIGVNANWLLTGEGEHRIDAINDSRISELESRIVRSQDLVESLERMILKK